MKKLISIILVGLILSGAAYKTKTNPFTGKPDYVGAANTADIVINSCANGETLVYNSGTSLWGCGSSGGTGTVTDVSVTTANGVSGSVANATTSPAISLTLEAITPSSVAASGTVTGSNLSGTNTGDQTNISGNAATVTTNANLTGPVTSSGNATTITDKAVTLAKMDDMATSSLIYRKTAGAGAPEVNTLATLKTDLGLTGTNSGDQTISLTGGVTGSGTGSFAATVVTNANLTGPVTSTGNATSITSQGIQTAGINWSSINNKELQSSGFNWSSVPANTIQKSAVNWSSVDSNVIQRSGINWDSFYVNSASALNWQAASVVPGWGLGRVLTVNSTSGVNWQSVDASYLTGSTLASGVTSSSLTSFGSSPTITTPTLTLATASSTTDARISWDTTNKILNIGNGTAALKVGGSIIGGYQAVAGITVSVFQSLYTTGIFTSEATVDEWLSPGEFKIFGFRASVRTAPGAAKSWTVTLRLNGSNTAVTCQISGASTTSCVDTTHSVSMNTGDFLTIGWVAAGSPADAAACSWGAVIYPDS